MKLTLHPAAALIVRADVPVSDCLTMMKDHNVGSLLIVNDAGDADPVGIFTERDLLKKLDLKNPDRFLSHPVRTVMTRSIKTIELSDLRKAGKLMLENGIRHLPVMSSGQLVGIVSMRDLFRMAQAALEKEPYDIEIGSEGRVLSRLAKVGLVSIDTNLVKTIEDLMAILRPQEADWSSRFNHWTAKWVVKNPKWFSEKLKEHTLMVVDLDELDTKEWTEVLKQINREVPETPTLVFMSPERHPKKILAMMDRLSTSKQFEVFHKPINILPLYDYIRSL